MLMRKSELVMRLSKGFGTSWFSAAAFRFRAAAVRVASLQHVNVASIEFAKDSALCHLMQPKISSLVISANYSSYFERLLKFLIVPRFPEHRSSCHIPVMSQSSHPYI
jgi:hypothetical protein